MVCVVENKVQIDSFVLVLHVLAGSGRVSATIINVKNDVSGPVD